MERTCGDGWMLEAACGVPQGWMLEGRRGAAPSVQLDVNGVSNTGDQPTTRVTPNSPRTRDTWPKPDSVVRMGIAAIETRDHAQIKQDPPYVSALLGLPSQTCSTPGRPFEPTNGRLVGAAMSPRSAQSKRGLRVAVGRAHQTMRQAAAGAAPHSNALGFVFQFAKLMRSPPFVCADRADIASSGRPWL